MTGIIGEAFVRVRPDTKAFAGETKRGVSSALKSGAAIAGVSLGLAGGIKLLKDASKAAKEAETIQLQAAAATKASGNAWETYGSQVDVAANKQAKLQSFDDEEVVQAYTRIIRNVNDVGQALDLTALAGDLATARMVNGQRDLAGAALVVAKVAGGNVGILRRYGIQLKEGATASEALAALQQKVAGSAEAFASGVEGGQARLNKVFGDTQEIIGGALNPAIDQLTRRVADYIEDANTSGETQRRVNEIFDTGEKVVKGFAGGLEQVHAIAGPVVDALGGVEQVVKGIVIAVAVAKVVRFASAIVGAATSFGLVAAASRATTAKVVADAAVAGAALDVAYRPRHVIVTGGGVPTGTGGPILGPNGKPLPPSGKNAPKASKATRFGRLVRRVPLARGLVGLGLTVGTIAAIEAVAILSIPGASAQGDDEDKFPFVKAFLDRVRAGVKPTAREVAAVKAVVGNRSINSLGNKDLRSLNNRLAAAASKGTSIGRRPEEGVAQREAARSAARPSVASTAPASRGAVRLTFKQVESRIAGFEEGQLDAQLARNLSAERKQLTREEAFLREQLKDTKRSAEQRRRLKDELLDVQGQIERIDSDIAAAKASTANTKASTAKKSAARVKSANDAALKASAKVFERDLRGAGISTAAHITGIITGRDPARTGVFATGAPARDGTSTSSSSATGSVQTTSIDQLLRDLAVGQAQRDRQQLDATVETNRLLRVLVPGAPAQGQRRRGRQFDRLTGVEATRETATLTGGLP